LNAISNGLAFPAPGNGVSGGVKPHKFGGNNWRRNLAATNAGVSDNNQRPVFASKRAFATRRASSGRRPERPLAAHGADGRYGSFTGHPVANHAERRL